MEKKKNQKTFTTRNQQQFIDHLARMIARKHVLSEWKKADSESSTPRNEQGLRQKG